MNNNTNTKPIINMFQGLFITFCAEVLVGFAIIFALQGCALDTSGQHIDATEQVDAESYDAGELTDSGVDPMFEDAGTPVDAGAPATDAGDPLVDAGGHTDDAGHPAPDAGTDGGPPSPTRGNPIALSDRYCALDDLRQVWCWNRFSTPDEVRLIAGSPTDTDPIVELSGECVRRASGALSCFAFSPEGAVDIIDPATSVASVVAELYPSPTLSRGCASTGTAMWCWHDGVMDLKYGGKPAVASTTDLPSAPGVTSFLINSAFGGSVNPDGTRPVGGTLFRGGVRSSLNDIGGQIYMAADGRICRQNTIVGFWDCRHEGASTWVGLEVPATTVNTELGCYDTGTAVHCGYFAAGASAPPFAEHDVATHAVALTDLHVMRADRVVCSLGTSIACHSVWGTVSPGPTPAW